MGSQLGLFQAGKWLQERERRLFGGRRFLSAIAGYGALVLGKEHLPVNVSDPSRELPEARQALHRAVEDYVHPQSDDVAAQLRPQIHDMLVGLQTADLVVRRYGAPIREPYGGTNHWLLDALLHEALDISRRDYPELVAAALVLTV